MSEASFPGPGPDGEQQPPGDPVRDETAGAAADARPDEGGSRAAAQVHDAVRRDILNADARRLTATLARDLVRPIVELNMGPQARYPKIELGLPDDSDVKVFAEVVAMLADRGLRVGQKTILDKLGIAAAGEGEAVLVASKGTGEGRIT